MTVLVIRRLPGKQDREYPYRVLVDGRQRAEVGDDATVQIGLTPGEHRVSLRVKWCGSRELPFTIAARRDCAHAMPPQCQAPAGAAVHYALAKRLHCPGNGEILDPMTSAEPLAIARELILRPGGIDDALTRQCARPGHVELRGLRGPLLPAVARRELGAGRRHRQRRQRQHRAGRGRARRGRREDRLCLFR